MYGDFSRNTFDPTKNYSRVLMQQGRVTLDADWNEQASIFLRCLRLLTRDIFGAHAGPSADLGFEIVGNLTGQALKDKLAQLLPAGQRRDQIENAILAGDVLIGHGRYYVDGLLVENHEPILYGEQRGAPFGDNLKPEEFQKFPRKLLVYLDVWERDVTYLEDAHIREVALGGPDTCARAQVFWEVRLLREPENAKSFDCSAADALARQPGTLRARTDPGSDSTELCVIAPDSRYRGTENQLYRVEVHRSGNANDSATFVWSRDNGSVVFPIRMLKGNVATLENLGRDRRSTLKSGDWVEIVDERIGARQMPGVLAQVERPPDRDNLEITLKPPPGMTLPTYADATKWRPLLRRWDHRGDPAKAGAIALTAKPNTSAGALDGWIDLEDGVQVWFSKDEKFEPVAQVPGNPMMIVTRKTVPANNLKELIAWLKAKPRQGIGWDLGRRRWITHCGRVLPERHWGALPIRSLSWCWSCYEPLSRRSDRPDGRRLTRSSAAPACRCYQSLCGHDAEPLGGSARCSDR